MKEYSLEKVCTKITDGAHFSPKAQENGYPMFSVKDMEEYGFSYRDCKLVGKEDFQKLVLQDCVPQKGDVLVAKDGSYLKQIFICEERKEEGILSSIAIFRPNSEIILPKYLMYLLKSPAVFNDVKNNYVSGTALPRIVLKDFKKIRFNIHSLSEQEKIVSVLEGLDKKIRTNREINNNLTQVTSQAKLNCHRPLRVCLQKDEWQLCFIGRQPDSEQLCCEHSTAA
jgi:type I restriction enzyme S subunit